MGAFALAAVGWPARADMGTGGHRRWGGRARAERAEARDVRARAAGSACARGGVKLGAGLDADGNGVLERPEIATIWFVCNDAGASIVTSASEAVGAHCADGGVRLERGVDANGDGQLAPSEVASTSFVCNGAGRARRARDGRGQI
jgi:hypothetical protein